MSQIPPTDQLMLVWKTYKKNRIVNFAIPADYRVKIEKEKRYKYLDLARELKKKKLWNMKVKVKPIVIGGLRNSPKEDLEIRLGNKKTRRDYSIIKIGRDTEKSSVDLRRLAVTQALVKDHLQTCVWKTLKE